MNKKELIIDYITNSDLMKKRKKVIIEYLSEFIYYLLQYYNDNIIYDLINIWFNNVDLNDLKYCRGIFENEKTNKKL